MEKSIKNNWTINYNVFQKIKDKNMVVEPVNSLKRKPLVLEDIAGETNIKRNARGGIILYPIDGIDSWQSKHIKLDYISLPNKDIAVSQWYNNQLLAYRTDRQIENILGENKNKILNKI